jgi:hypothetical protein
LVDVADNEIEKSVEGHVGLMHYGLYDTVVARD